MRFQPWRASLVVVAMLVMQGMAVHGQGSQGNVTQILQGGLAALKESRFDEAITAFRTGLELAPRDALTALYLATAYSMKKDAAGALEWLSHGADWGYEDVDQIFKHPDLTFIRNQPGFTQVIEEIQNRFPASRPKRNFSKDETDRGLELVAMVRSEVGSGAAIIIGRDGNRLLLATANHVVRKGGSGARALEVQLKSLAPRWEKAAVLPAIEDPELDLAFIAVENIVDSDLKVCDLPLHLAGDASRLKRGDSVSPVGYPNGILWAMPLTADRASQAFPTQISFESQFIRVGFSGGALLNQAGEVVGMITADEPPLGRAIPLASILNAARARQYSVLLSDPDERVKRPLHVAARDGNVGALKRLMENCVDPNGTDDQGRTALHEAAAQGSAEAVRLLLGAGARLRAWTVMTEDKSFREWGTPLHFAARSGRSAVVNAFLAAGEDVDLRTLLRNQDKALEQYDTPLRVAARYDGADAAEALLAAGAARDGIRRGRMTPLEIAAASGSVRVAKTLIQHGALQAVPNRNGVSSPLHYAAEAGSAEMLRLLVDSGLYVNVRDNDSDTPLHKAAEGGHVSAVEALLSLKADVNAEGDDFKTPLYVAAEKGKADVVKVLLANGADPNKFVKGRTNALAIAAERTDVESIKVLVPAHADIGDSLNRLLDSSDRCRYRDQLTDCLERIEAGARILIEGGADLRLKIRDGRQPLHLAAANGLANAVELLVERGAALATGTEGDNVPPLQLAADQGHVEVVRRLITAKAPLNQQDADGRTALYRAVEKKRVNVVNALLQAGADPNIGSRRYGDTPVLEAASSSVDILALLLKAGANPNSASSQSRLTPLHRAAREKNPEAVRLLLQAGAKPSADSDGRWPLHVAIQSGGSEPYPSPLAIIELLVKGGSPVDAPDDERATPLHYAADNGNAAAVKILLSAHARVNAVDKCGSTPLAHVLNEREELAVAVAELLLNAGADVNVKNTCRRQTLLQMVEDRGFVTLRQLLVARGAR